MRDYSTWVKHKNEKRWIEKGKKHTFTLPPSSFPQAWAAWCGDRHSREKESEVSAWLYREPQRRPTKFQADPWALGGPCMLPQTQAPDVRWHLTTPVASVAPAAPGSIYGHQAPHRLPAHPHSCQLLRTWAAPEAPGGSHDTRWSVEHNNPRVPAQPSANWLQWPRVPPMAPGFR